MGNLADRARTAGGLAYEIFATDPKLGEMTTGEFSEAIANRAPTPRLNQAAQDLGTIGRAIVTQPVATGKAIVQGEVNRAREAMSNPRAAGEYAGSFIDPMRIAAALRKTAPVLELDVYHGTPHRFEPTEANPLGEFDASKIGTGEGAQAYGHGIYYAENPDVAKGYQSTLRETNAWEIDGQRAHGVTSRLDAKPINHAAKALEIFDGDKKSAIAWLKNSESPMDLEAAQLLSKSKTAQKVPGSLYKADLPDEMIDRMLDWDKPLSEQSAAVREALMPLVRAAMSKRGTPKYALDYSANRAIGGDIVKDLLVGNGVTRADVSRMLKDAGIPGIKYLDAGSRDGGSGTRNFVVFPGEEKKVKILERK